VPSFVDSGRAASDNLGVRQRGIVNRRLQFSSRRCVMSQKAAAEFVGQLAIDATLRDELATALADAPDPAQALARMVEFAARHGSEVTADELAEFAPADDRGDVTDEQLSRVAGGSGVQPILPYAISRRIATNCADGISFVRGTNC
jgi:hypothetical protein